MKVTKQEYLQIQKEADEDRDLYQKSSNFEKYFIARNICFKKYKSDIDLRTSIYIANFFIPLDNDFIIADQQICNKDIRKLAKYYDLYDLYQNEVYRNIVINIIKSKRRQLRRFYDSYLEECEAINEGGIKNNVYVYKNGKRR
jgi:hypothetical protein